tara:strand:+ start:19160 stop:21700 length:2541 start_codon:yes stop_codon:yes gene_type:complete
VKNSDRLNIIKAAKASGHKGGYLELFEEFRTNSKESEGHIEAETTREIRQGLEGAAYGTSANLNFEKSFNHMLEGRQDYAVKVQADGMYQGILSPDEEYFMVDTSSTVGEAPVLKYGGVPIKQEVKPREGTTYVADKTAVIKDPVRNTKQFSDEPMYEGQKHSTHLMAWGEGEGGKFHAWPTIFQDDSGGWYKGGIDEAVKKDEVHEFDTAEAAEAFAAGSWKEKKKETKKFRTGGISKAVKYQGSDGSNVVKNTETKSKATIFIGSDTHSDNTSYMFDADFERMEADLDEKYGVGNYQVVRATDVQKEMNSKLYGPEGSVDYDPEEYEKALKRKNARSFELFKKNNPDYDLYKNHKISSAEDLMKDEKKYWHFQSNYGYYSYKDDEEWVQANDTLNDLEGVRVEHYKQQQLYETLSSEEKLAAYKSHFESMGEGSDIYILKHGNNMFLSKAGTLSEGTRSDFKYGNTPDKIDTFTEALNAWGPGTTGTCYMGTCTGTDGAKHITNETGMTTKAQKGNWAGYYNRSGTYGDDQTFDEQFFNPQNKGNQQSGGYYNTYTKEGDNVNVESTGYNAPIQNAPRYQGDTSSGIVTDSVETAAAPVVDDTYSFTRDGYEVADTDLSGYDIELLYSAIQQHEHRGYFPDGKMAEGYDPFIRTKKKGSGSSAYGPGQLTEFIMSDITTPGIRQYYDVENMNTDFHKSLVDQSKLFLKYGGDDWKKFIDKETQLVDGMTQQEVQDLYEYGGAGTLGGSDDNRAEYKKLNKQIIEGKLRKTIEKGKEGDDVLKLMLKQYGTGSNSYVTGVEKIYNKLLKEKKNKNKKKEKKTIDPFPNIKDPLLRQQLMRNMDKA